jgi:hypothetical protein
MEKKEFQKFVDITKTQISEWKKTKGKLKQIEIPLNEDDFDGTGEQARFIICAPTRNILSAIAHYGQEKKIDKVNELLINSCVLGGDMKYLDDTEGVGDTSIYLSVLEEVGKLMETKKVTSKYI